MKVGIDFSKQTGGGHTYTTEILQALSKLIGESPHTFIILGTSRNRFSDFKSLIPPNLPVSILPESQVYENPNKWDVERVLNILRRRIFKTNPAQKSNPEPIDVYDQFARSDGIQLVWFLDQKYEDFPDIPYIATLWDLQHRLQSFFPEVEEKGIWEYREAGLSRYLQRAAIVITCSQTAQAEIERFYQVPAERIKILPHPTPGFALEPTFEDGDEVLKRYDIPAGYIFYPAQFWAHKNHINLLLALNILREENDLVLHAVFIGKDMGNETYISKMVGELGLSNQVHILGYVSQSDLVALYKHALALSYMTFFGPDNLPPLEAFGLGCPVIASNVSGAYEQLGDAALIVDPGNPNQIAQAILSVYRDADLRKILIQRGRVRAQKWTGSDFVRGVFKIIDEFEPIRRSWA